jgi:hypothetical protein
MNLNFWPFKKKVALAFVEAAPVEELEEVDDTEDVKEEKVEEDFDIETAIEEQDKVIQRKMDDHAFTVHEHSASCQELGCEIERRKETQVKSKQISSRPIKGRSKTEILRSITEDDVSLEQTG